MVYNWEYSMRNPLVCRTAVSCHPVVQNTCSCKLDENLNSVNCNQGKCNQKHVLSATDEDGVYQSCVKR